jgi:predicted DNA-binding transcriptional regulator AlpA
MQLDLMDITEVCRLFGDVNASTIYRWVRAERVPRPLRVGPGTSRWLRSECEAALTLMVEAHR